MICGLLGLLGIAGSWVETVSLQSGLWEAGVSLTSVPLWCDALSVLPSVVFPPCRASSCGNTPSSRPHSDRTFACCPRGCFGAPLGLLYCSEWPVLGTGNLQLAYAGFIPWKWSYPPYWTFPIAGRVQWNHVHVSPCLQVPNSKQTRRGSLWDNWGYERRWEILFRPHSVMSPWVALVRLWCKRRCLWSDRFGSGG